MLEVTGLITPKNGSRGESIEGVPIVKLTPTPEPAVPGSLMRERAVTAQRGGFGQADGIAVTESAEAAPTRLAAARVVDNHAIQREYHVSGGIRCRQR